MSDFLTVICIGCHFYNFQNSTFYLYPPLIFFIIFSMYIKHFFVRSFLTQNLWKFFFHKYLPCPCTFSVNIARNSRKYYRYFVLAQCCIIRCVLYVPNPDYRLAALLGPAVWRLLISSPERAFKLEEIFKLCIESKV